MPSVDFSPSGNERPCSTGTPRLNVMAAFGLLHCNRNEKCAAFPGGALTDFWFPKRGVGGLRALGTPHVTTEAHRAGPTIERFARLILRSTSMLLPRFDRLPDGPRYPTPTAKRKQTSRVMRALLRLPAEFWR
jgi:hypothetical protein